MNAGPDVGGRIRSVERKHPGVEKVLASGKIRTKVLTVRPERRDDQEDRHSRYEESKYPPVFVLGREQEIEHRHKNVRKP